LRGFAKLISLFSLLALLSARFSRIDLPAFLAAPPLGDFPDIRNHAFLCFALPDTIPAFIFYASPSKTPSAGLRSLSADAPELDRRGYAGF
jgi:hypothetical protein